MRLIAHRANLYGPNPETENTLAAINECISKDMEFEVDLRVINGKLFIGHDGPDTEVHESLLIDVGFSRKAWVHCKNQEALAWCQNRQSSGYPLRFFWHDKDDYTIVSDGVIWCNVGVAGVGNSILVLPEQLDIEKRKELISNSKHIGICTDYPLQTLESIVPSEWG